MPPGGVQAYLKNNLTLSFFVVCITGLFAMAGFVHTNRAQASLALEETRRIERKLDSLSVDFTTTIKEFSRHSGNQDVMLATLSTKLDNSIQILAEIKQTLKERRN